mgnify:CR=1 FL=1
MPDTSRISKGRRGENIAAEYLIRRGFVLLERNTDGWAVRWI